MKVIIALATLFCMGISEKEMIIGKVIDSI